MDSIPRLSLNAHVERERKFLVHGSARWKIIKKAEFAITIRQAYLYKSPLVECRVRHVFDPVLGSQEATIDVKEGAGEGRLESSLPINPSIAREMLDSMKTITKVRHVIGGWEIDIYLGEREGMIVAEFEMAEDETTVEIPDWLSSYVIRDVTEDEAFKNKNLVD